MLQKLVLPDYRSHIYRCDFFLILNRIEIEIERDNWIEYLNNFSAICGFIGFNFFEVGLIEQISN